MEMWRIFSFVVLLLLTSSTKAWIDNITHYDNLCHRVWPTQGGNFSNYPPYWQLPNCPPVQFFTANQIAKCLKGKTMYVIGNSVARQAPFDLIEMLGGMATDREHQKEQCPKHAGDWPSSCHSEYRGVKFKYLYVQWMDGHDYTSRGGFPFYFQRAFDPLINNFTVQTGRLPNARPGYGVNKDDVPLTGGYVKELYSSDDNCRGQVMRDCLARFLNGSTADDFLLFTMGMAYPVGDKSEVAQQKAEVLRDGKPQLDMAAFLVSQAVNFKAHLAALFKGQVYRVTMAPSNPHGIARAQGAYWYRTDRILWNLWQTADEDKPWYTIDQWAINTNRIQYYNDLVHFNGVLTYAMLFQVLNIMCPGGGQNSDMTGALVKADNDDYVYVGRDYFLHRLELDADGKLPLYVSTFPRIAVTKKQLVDYVIELNFPRIPLLTHKSVRTPSQAQIYLVDENGKKRRFMNANQFFKAGFQDFNEVIDLPLDFLDLIPNGPDMTG